MSESPPPPRSQLPLILTVLGAVCALIGMGRCGAFGHPVDDFGASGALLLVISAILLFTALIKFFRNTS